MARHALFTGLIFDEYDQPVATKFIGDEAQYVVDDEGFFRHIDAEKVDREIVTFFVEQLEDNKDMAISQALRMMGKDDLFAKAAVDAQLNQVSVDAILKQGIPQQARDMLGMVGFKVIINHHGELVRLDQPMIEDDGDW